MTGSAESACAGLPALWCRRLQEELYAAEEQVVVCAHRAGDGLERLAALWDSDGLVVTLRASDVDSVDALSGAVQPDGSVPASAASTPSWFVVVVEGEIPAPSGLRSVLRPGQRLLVLDRGRSEETGCVTDEMRGGHPQDERSVAWPKALDPRLRVEELVDWASERWSLELPADEAMRLLAECAGELRWIEARLSAHSGKQGGTSGDASSRPRNSVPRFVPDAGTESSVSPRIELELLGVPRIRWVSVDGDGGLEELRWGYRGVLEVVAALAVAPDMRLPRRELLDRLWPALDADDALKRFYPAVSHARRFFAVCSSSTSAILASGGVYRLNPDWGWGCDVKRLRDAVRLSAGISDDLLQVEVGHEVEESSGPVSATSLRATLEAAWSSYRGDFLETLRSAWIRAEREEQRRNYLIALRRLAALRHSEPEAASLEDVLRTILVADPVAEDAHVALMRLYSRRGRADLVRRQYDRMCRVLMDDLGLQPMDRTVREVERLVAS